ncbi:MAG: UTP--glucose-1-phosphate uridylyltransferase [Phycisphaerales bacterium]
MGTATGLEVMRERLVSIGQGHVLAFWDGLSDAERSGLLEQLGSIELERVPSWVDRYVRSRPEAGVDPGELTPAPCYSAVRSDGTAEGWDAGAMRRLGESLVRAGKVAAFTVAGGQGTRLGFDGPKGTFPATPVTGRALFAVLGEQVLAASRKFGVRIPWYIMTSPLNHADTVSFFERHGYFGLDRADVMFFNQGVLPSFDRATGRMLLASRCSVATNPDGHGGSLRALWGSGAIGDMRRRGVEHISYTQIDNPLAKVIDPVFIGLHAGAPDSSGQMSSKMVAKANAGERVGVFCRAGGKTRVIEYSDLPEELASARDDGGALRFNAGSIAIHMIGVGFVESLNDSPDGFALPLHRADKKVDFVDPETGEAVSPREPNAVKLETFVFDALPLCESSIVYETIREEEFAPIKNAEGADSPLTSRALQSERAARWLERAGVRVPRRESGAAECVIELSPLTALEPEDLKEAEGLPVSVEKGAELVV